MRRFVASLLVMVVSSFFAPVLAEDAPIDWQKELREDFVVTKGKMLVIDDFGLLDFGNAPRRRLRLRWHAEAPAKSFISRDAFVAVFNSMQTSMMLTIVIGERQVTRADLADFSYEPMDDNPNVAADMEFRFVLTKDGVDIAVSTDGHEPALSTMAWPELFKRREVAKAATFSMAPAKTVKLPPACERYLKSFRACVADIPVAAREAVTNSIDTMEREWLSASDHAALEPACKSAADDARKNMKAACPKVEW